MRPSADPLSSEASLKASRNVDLKNVFKASAAAVRFVLNTSQHWLSGGSELSQWLGRERLYETTSEAEGVRVLKDPGPIPDTHE